MSVRPGIPPTPGISRLSLERFAAPGGCFHIRRKMIRVRTPMACHAHDFPELFWVESGSGRHQINGVENPLSAGDLLFICAEDEHGLWSTDGCMTIVNLAIAPILAEDLRLRYGASGDLWAGGPGIRRRRLGPIGLRRLAPHVESLTRAYGGADERLAVDRCLLDLVDCLLRSPHQVLGPEWLEQAIATLAADPAALRLGTAALVRACGYTREHVARSVRQHYGETPRLLIERLRLDRAALNLRMSDRPILDLALEQGYAGLGHFYRRFRARFGCTPRAYRSQHLSTSPDHPIL